MSTDKDTELRDKIAHMAKSLVGDAGKKEMLFAALSDLGFKVFNTPASMQLFPDEIRLANATRGIILDVETEGLDWTTDKVIQLCMLEFWYDDMGIVSTGETFDRLIDPGRPLSPEITELTGITDEMLAGKRLADAEISEFLVGAELVTAHHANFDRKMAEQNFPKAGFETLAWHCSIEQIDWKARGINSPKLELIALSMGIVYEAHNASADCDATGLVLMNTAKGTAPAFQEMLETGRDGLIMILATDSPFDKKDLMKEAGYRWDGDAEHYSQKSWWKTLPNRPEALEAEAAFLKTIYGRDVAVPCYRMAADVAYSNRKGAVDRFRTADVLNPSDVLGQETRANQPLSGF